MADPFFDEPFFDPFLEPFFALPPEVAEPGMCAKLVRSLYGMRGAPANWEELYSERSSRSGSFKAERVPAAFTTLRET